MVFVGGKTGDFPRHWFGHSLPLVLLKTSLVGMFNFPCIAKMLIPLSGFHCNAHRHIDATWTVDTELFLSELKPLQNGNILVGLFEKLGGLTPEKIRAAREIFSSIIFYN